MTTQTTVPSTFTLRRERLDLRFRRCALTSRELVARDYVRIRLTGRELAGFGSPGHDDHVRLFLPHAEPTTVEELRAAPSREMTPVAWGTDDAGDGWLDLELALHGDEGVAGVWAATAPLGAPAGLGGPRGSMRIDGTPQGWLLAGDETAVPQIRRYAALVPQDAAATVLVEVAGPGHEIPLDAPVAVEYVHRGAAPAGTALAERLDAITAEERPAGDVFGFVAAEQTIVRAGRALLCDRWGLDPDRVVVKGYWRRGDSAYHAPH
jgi:NADPH-dependent ferric siderophore reductase